MTDRYDDLTVSPDPTKAETLREELRVRLVVATESAAVTNVVAPVDPDQIAPERYALAPEEDPERRSHGWLKVAAIAAALLLLGSAALAIVRLTDRDTVEVGPADTVPNSEPRVVAEVPDRFGPNGLKATSGAVWVTNSGQVARIDPSTNQVVATIEPVPTPTVIDATETALWIVQEEIVETGPTTVTVLRYDPSDNALVATITFQVVVPPITVGVAATDTAVWVSAGDVVTRIDPATNQVVATVPVQARPMFVAATDTAVWVTTDQPNVLTRIDPASNQVTATIPGFVNPQQIAATDDDVWVVDLTSGTVIRVDPATNQIEAKVPLASAGLGLAMAGPDVWVLTLDGNLSRIDPVTNLLTDTLGLESRLPITGSNSPSITGAPGAIWLTAEDARSVIRIDPGTH